VSTGKSPVLEQLPSAEVVIGDLEDFEQSAKATDCDLLMTHSHGRQAAERLGKPLLRVGIPTFDRIGNAHKCYVAYVGTRNLVYEVGNALIEQIPHLGPGAWPLPEAALAAARPALPAEVHLPAVIERLRKPDPVLSAAKV
jgi:nitrogenase molybdenum-iron protein NifN